MESRRAFVLSGFSNDVNGRQFVFQDDATTLPVCALCDQVSSQWYVLNCCHRFCQSCFNDVVQKTPLTLRCPLDSKSFRPRRPLEPSEDTTVLERSVSCWNQRHGCDFIGTVTEMIHHFGSCHHYEVTCRLCGSAILWRGLAAHVKSDHGRTTRASKANELPLPDAHEDVVPAEPLSLDSLLACLADLASRCTDIRSTQDSHFLQLTRSVDSLKTQLQASHESPRTRLQRESSANVEAKRICCERPEHEDLPLSKFEWKVTRFSEIRVGIQYFRSEIFEVAPGYQVQLKGYIDGITRVELKVAATIWKTAHATQDCGDCRTWQYTRACLFQVVNIERPADSSEVRYDLDEVFKTSTPLLDTPNGVTSPWLDISSIDRATFQRDFVSEDAFVIMFSIEASAI
ncbi:uncharacterized protein LOC121834863 [Ixodes scapularis]|uniref:uncharacterized protein LOC121834863 n=1 Tax=Ixodes scapularis TaxID=6945 RepID=UPI001A9F17A0|nr:uncharacterized protein LOC121834863 [Ixodes scapularis]